jgi:hypothetical protein
MAKKKPLADLLVDHAESALKTFLAALALYLAVNYEQVFTAGFWEAGAQFGFWSAAFRAGVKSVAEYALSKLKR